MTIEQFDRVRLLVDRPDQGLRRGMTGVAVDVYEKPCRGYEVEFMNAEGRTIALCGFHEHEAVFDPWTRDEMLDWIDRVEAQVAKFRQRFPSDYALDAVDRALKQIRTDVIARWPLDERYAMEMGLGVFAIRNLEPDFPDLASQVIALQSAARKATATT